MHIYICTYTSLYFLLSALLYFSPASIHTPSTSPSHPLSPTNYHTGLHESQHTNPQEQGLSITALSPITDAVRRRIDTAQAALEALDTEEKQLEKNRSRSPHIYTGESLLEIVLSDHAYKYHNEQGLVHGATVRGEHQVCPLSDFIYFFVFLFSVFSPYPFISLHSFFFILSYPFY